MPRPPPTPQERLKERVEAQRASAAAVAQELAHFQAASQAEAARSRQLDDALHAADAKVLELAARAAEAEAEVARLAEDGKRQRFQKKWGQESECV